MFMIYLAIAGGVGGLAALVGYLLTEFVLFSRRDPFTPDPPSRAYARARAWGGLSVRRPAQPPEVKPPAEI